MVGFKAEKVLEEDNSKTYCCQITTHQNLHRDDLQSQQELGTLNFIYRTKR